MDREPEVSLVIVFSDAAGDPVAVLKRYLEAAAAQPRAAELIVVSNGLGEEIEARIASFLQERRVPGRFLRIWRCAPESNALTQAFRTVRGEVVVTLPSYIQVEPADAFELAEAVFRGEHDCVASWRSPRIDGGADAFKSRLFNRLTPRVQGRRFHDLNSSLRAMTRQVVEDVSVYGDLYRFLPILASQHGYRVGERKVRHLEERVRSGDYALGVYVRRMLDVLTLFFIAKFTSKPLRFFGLVGSTVLAAGAALLAWICYERLFLGVSLGGRPVLVFAVMAIVLGVQLFSIGLLGELIIFTHARDLKEYKIEEIYERVGDAEEGEDVESRRETGAAAVTERAGAGGEAEGAG